MRNQPHPQNEEPAPSNSGFSLLTLTSPTRQITASCSRANTWKEEERMQSAKGGLGVSEEGANSGGLAALGVVCGHGGDGAVVSTPAVALSAHVRWCQPTVLHSLFPTAPRVAQSGRSWTNNSKPPPMAQLPCCARSPDSTTSRKQGSLRRPNWRPERGE
jgi:hypothetical protein